MFSAPDTLRMTAYNEQNKTPAAQQQQDFTSTAVTVGRQGGCWRTLGKIALHLEVEGERNGAAGEQDHEHGCGRCHLPTGKHNS